MFEQYSWLVWVVAIVVSIVVNMLGRYSSLLWEPATSLEEIRRECERQIAELRREYEAAIKQLHKQIDDWSRRYQLTAIELEKLKAARAAPAPASVAEFKPDVLAVWPHAADLDLAASARALYNSGIHYAALVGDTATRERVLTEFSVGKFNVLELGGHGIEVKPEVKDSGYILGDWPSPPGWWSRLCQQHGGVEVALVLSCYGADVGHAIKNAGVPYVIAATQEIEDKHCIEFAKVFYFNLATGKDPERSFNFAKLSLPPEMQEHAVRML